MLLVLHKIVSLCESFIRKTVITIEAYPRGCFPLKDTQAVYLQLGQQSRQQLRKGPTHCAALSCDWNLQLDIKQKKSKEATLTTQTNPLILRHEFQARTAWTQLDSDTRAMKYFEFQWGTPTAQQDSCQE